MMPNFPVLSRTTNVEGPPQFGSYDFAADRTLAARTLTDSKFRIGLNTDPMTYCPIYAPVPLHSPPSCRLTSPNLPTEKRLWPPPRGIQQAIRSSNESSSHKFWGRART